MNSDPTTAELKAGDVVRLKSGGPLMTVDQILPGGVGATWTHWTNTPRHDQFPSAALVRQEKVWYGWRAER